ncbi:DHHW motif protein [Fontibacillus phaseoli]|uniref:DHHW motif protein n=1 Tax=Fontibacillus phaseoli TaxID=1416533 RepID=A0A369B0S9_9BACL|nr:DHHW family protein [Fontibacillus phaseoli]RCX14027.1 DHHW motif protein [Fontibacillus phaseoli]
MKFRNTFNTLFFLLVLFGFGIVNLAFFQSGSVSSLEQRNLVRRPAFSLDRFISGEFPREFDDYFSDHFAFRTLMAKAGAYLMEFKGLPDKNEATILQQGGDNTSQNLKPGNGTGAAANTGQAVQYLIFKDRAYTLFKYSEPSAERYADALNRFKSAVDPEIRVYSLLAPTSADFIEEEKYRELSYSQKAAFDHINESLNPEIKPIDAYGMLARHIDEELYFRTDHHWTALGAYYAYVKLMDALGEEPVPLNSYLKGEIKEFLGSAYKATLSFRLRAHPDTIIYYEPAEKYTYTRYSTAGKEIEGGAVDPEYAKASGGLYSVFLGGDFPWGEIQTEHKNGRKILVVKDSYANALIPFLIPHFENIYYIDPRFFSGSLTGFVKEHDISEVLFLNNSTVARSQGIAELINKRM